VKVDFSDCGPYLRRVSFPIENRAKRPSADFEASFPSRLFRHPTTKKQRTRPHGPPGNAYLVICKVGVTNTYANENEEQPSLAWPDPFRTEKFISRAPVRGVARTKARTVHSAHEVEPGACCV